MVAGEYCDVTTGSPDGLSVSEKGTAVSNLSEAALFLQQ
jgi:hypothetical protein